MVITCTQRGLSLLFIWCSNNRCCDHGERSDTQCPPSSAPCEPPGRYSQTVVIPYVQHATSPFTMVDCITVMLAKREPTKSVDTTSEEFTKSDLLAQRRIKRSVTQEVVEFFLLVGLVSFRFRMARETLGVGTRMALPVVCPPVPEALLATALAAPVSVMTMFRAQHDHGDCLCGSCRSGSGR